MKPTNKYQFLVLTLAIIIFFALVPVLFGKANYLYFINMVGIYSIAVIGLNLLIGVAGILSLGHAAFFGLGGYISGMLSIHLGWNPFLAIAASCMIIAVISILIAIPFSKFVGLYMALGTLGLGIILQTLVNSGGKLTGGPNGLVGLPPLSIGTFTIRGHLAYFFLIWISVVVITLLINNLMKSRVGRALNAIHSDEVASSSVGIHITKFKTLVFAVGSILAAFSGSLLVFYMQYISPNALGIKTTIDMVIMAYLGGVGTLLGPMIGTFVYKFIPQLLLSHPEYEILLSGIILLVIVLFFQGGIIGTAVNAINFLKQKGKRSRANPPTEIHESKEKQSL